MFDEEARATHELAGPAGQDAAAAFGTVVGFDVFFFDMQGLSSILANIPGSAMKTMGLKDRLL